MAAVLRLVLTVAAFGLASSIRSGVLPNAWGHPTATAAEGAIPAALASGIAAASIRPASARGIAPAAPGSALLGILVGASTILVGAGPQGAPDAVLHALLVLGLAAPLTRARGCDERAPHPGWRRMGAGRPGGRRTVGHLLRAETIGARSP